MAFKRSYTRTFTGFFFLLFAVTAFSQQPEVKIDFNMVNRRAAEVVQDGYTPWVVSGASTDSMTANGVKFFINKGSRGNALSTTYYKAGVQLPPETKFDASFTCDGITVNGGDYADGSQIDLIIRGLPPGNHALISYHNLIDNLKGEAICPLDIYVDGVRVIDDLIPSVRRLNITECQSANLSITAHRKKDVVISFRAETSGRQAIKNVIINGFQLNGIDASNKASAPVPTHREEHLDVSPGGNFQLRWRSSAVAVSHDIYFGTDPEAVAGADRTSAFYKGNQAKEDTTFQVDGLFSMLTYYWRIDEVTDDKTYKGITWKFRTRQLAFPGAEGYGRFARGGRGGKVVEVTNLNDSGPGSLRDAVTHDVGPRTIVFTVSGIITLNSRLVLSQPYVTVAGQTAPGKGICIRSAPFGITANDAIVRFMRVRVGGGTTYDGMGLTGANHSIVDHCSISWTIDEAFSSRGAKNITLQRTLISEALNAANHHKYPPGKEHGYAATIGGDIGSFHHNLLAHCYGRNWSLGGGLSGDGYYAGRLDITNNVVYNWGSRATDGGAREVNFVNNYYKPGAGTTYFYAYNAQHEGVGTGLQRCYFMGNIMPGHFNENNQATGRTATGKTVTYETYVESPFLPSEITTQSAREAYKNVLSDVGCTQPLLDDHDIRIIKETATGTYTYSGSKTGKHGFPDNEADVGGFEVYPEEHRPKNWDSDHDGMPDWWEAAKGLNPNSPAGDFSESNADPDMDGFTNLEYYLDWMASPHYTTRVTKPITIDLKTLTKGYVSSPAFTVSDAVNGSVSISGSIVKFISSSAGLGTFIFTVTDSEGDSMTRKVNIRSL